MARGLERYGGGDVGAQKYICTCYFELPKAGEESEFTVESLEVFEGTIWEASNEPKSIGADVILEYESSLWTSHNTIVSTWIEISQDRLNEYFEPIE